MSGSGQGGKKGSSGQHRKKKGKLRIFGANKSQRAETQRKLQKRLEDERKRKNT
jgi:hypothetical protein